MWLQCAPIATEIVVWFFLCKHGGRETDYLKKGNGPYSSGLKTSPLSPRVADAPRAHLLSVEQCVIRS